ncbi:MAG TPA: hypothetical protein VFS00_10900, partial [Polyangiaceae bacterium]|nr:hypothetical protein [Polyangiaceae bacterium]
MSGAAPGPAGPALARARRARFVTGAVASGVLCALSARTEAPWQGFAFVALVPWLLALRLAASSAEALAAGLAMALALCVAAFPWLPAALALYSQSPSTALPWLLLVAAAPLLEPQLVAYALARHALARRPGPRAALVAAAA